MKNFWKWILGIVIILVVLFGLSIGSHLLMRAIYPSTTVEVEGIAPRMMVVSGEGDLEEFVSPMMIGGRGIIGNGGMMHRGGGLMTLGWLLPLALIGLVIYGAYRLGKRNPQVVAAPAAPAVVRTCARCGAPVQEGWNHCASCGRKL